MCFITLLDKEKAVHDERLFVIAINLIADNLLGDLLTLTLVSYNQFIFFYDMLHKPIAYEV